MLNWKYNYLGNKGSNDCLFYQSIRSIIMHFSCVVVRSFSQSHLIECNILIVKEGQYMNKSVKISQQRRRITLRPDESVVVRCRDNNDNNRRRRRIVITLRPGDRVLVRCRHN
jgi:hypothetical protein